MPESVVQVELLQSGDASGDESAKSVAPRAADALAQPAAIAPFSVDDWLLVYKMAPYRLST